MTVWKIIFWVCAFLVFYTYFGYGIVLFLLVQIKEWIRKPHHIDKNFELPDVTLLIAAYNEEDVVIKKMENCDSLKYPEGKFHVVWVTDGSTDNTNALLAQYPDVQVFFSPERKGKTAAVNRAMALIKSPIVVLTDANTMLNPEAVELMARCFGDPNVGCVAGEKRVKGSAEDGAAASEGMYWKYESFLKDLDYRLYSAQGAAGELYAVRRELWTDMPEDTLLDDFIASMTIAENGKRIAYCKNAYAVEGPSANIDEERKRKKRISAGGLQSVWAMRRLLNPWKHKRLTFQYVSHRVLRWTITPVALFAMYPVNLIIVLGGYTAVYGVIFFFQTALYVTAIAGRSAERMGRRKTSLFVPYYFVFMNLSVIRGWKYFFVNRKKGGVWEKAKRA
ncbi:MAG: glycosyltransferase family 2 protein [Bacteroidales bacterium]|nr:glycosyltransferase family 2 protein [Bacteroidales bacterium]